MAANVLQLGEPWKCTLFRQIAVSRRFIHTVNLKVYVKKSK